MTIIKRTSLGRPLTWEELDSNFSQVDGLVSAANTAVGTATAKAAEAAASAAIAQEAAGYKDQLSSSQGASLVGTSDNSNIQNKLDKIEPLYTVQGFNVVGKFLNLDALRNTAPTVAGKVVYVASAYSLTEVESHVGGGFFQSVENTQAWVDDGGVVIKPVTGTIVWKRINFTEYDMQFWGVKADGTTDNAAAITRATQYAKTKQIILQAPAGNINTSEMIPIYNNMGIRGRGKAESTVFWKTTNNAFPFKKNGVTITSVDCFCGFVPDAYDRSDFTMAAYVQRGILEDCMFRRLGLTQSNVDTLRPEVGIYLNKIGACTLRRVSVENGYIGLQCFDGFSSTLEQVSATVWPGHGLTGIQFSNYLASAGTLNLSGTSIDGRLIQTSGYQFGFEIARLQYSTFTNCTAENITPISGQTVSYAFRFIDPLGVTLNTCATEFVKGGQIQVTSFGNLTTVRTLSVNGYMPIDQQSPVASTPIYTVDSGGSGQLKVTFTGGDLTRNSALTNNAAPVVSGAGAKVVIINAGGEDWTATSSGVFTRLA